jgi:hypothetical protein
MSLDRPLSSPRALSAALSAALALSLAPPLTPAASATGLLELSLGGAHPLGGQLSGGFGPGGQLSVGLGGQLTGRAHGTALYGYLSLSLDSFEQRVSAPLRGVISHTQANPALGARLYWEVAPSTRMWADLGVGVSYNSALITLEGLEEAAQRVGSSAFTLGAAVGLQYKLRPRLSLSAGYHAAFYLEEDAALAERALRVPTASAAWGRGRASLGVAWSF